MPYHYSLPHHAIIYTRVAESDYRDYSLNYHQESTK